MHVNRNFLFLHLAALTIFSCNGAECPSEQEDIASLMKVHEEARSAHFRKDAQAMVNQFASNMVSVNAGKIHPAQPEKDIHGFQSYFNAVRFKKWDDLKPPEIRFSEDRSLAYMVVDKLVVLDTKDSIGNPIEETTHYAWVGIYRRAKDNHWKLECIASTNMPEVVKPLAKD